jgi:hypothetical protein
MGLRYFLKLRSLKHAAAVVDLPSSNNSFSGEFGGKIAIGESLLNWTIFLVRQERRRAL